MSAPSIGNPDHIKYLNICRVFQLIQQYQPISRIELSRKINISNVTVSNCVDYLLSNQLITSIGTLSPRRGRPSTQLVINKDRGILIGVELDAMVNRMLVTDFAGTILKEINLSDRLERPTVYITNIGHQIDIIEKDYQDLPILGISVALSGFYDYENGRITYIANRKDWLGFPLGQELKKLHPEIPIFVERLANCGVLGESFFGSHPSEGVASYLLCSWGLGVGTMRQSEDNRGLFSPTSRFGHTTINYRGRQCQCGNRGCLEAYASLSALLGELYPDRSPSQELLQELTERYRQKDPEVLSSLEEVEKYLTVGIASLINAYQPQTLYLGGLVFQFLSDGFQDRLNTYVLEHIPENFRRGLEIVPATLGDLSVCYGSIANIRNHMIDIIWEN